MVLLFAVLNFCSSSIFIFLGCLTLPLRNMFIYWKIPDVQPAVPSPDTLPGLKRQLMENLATISIGFVFNVISWRLVLSALVAHLKVLMKKPHLSLAKTMWLAPKSKVKLLEFLNKPTANKKNTFLSSVSIFTCHRICQIIYWGESRRIFRHSCSTFQDAANVSDVSRNLRKICAQKQKKNQKANLRIFCLMFLSKHLPISFLGKSVGFGWEVMASIKNYGPFTNCRYNLPQHYCELKLRTDKNKTPGL